MSKNKNEYHYYLAIFITLFASITLGVFFWFLETTTFLFSLGAALIVGGIIFSILTFVYLGATVLEEDE